jgi:hypothetical protein
LIFLLIFYYLDRNRGLIHRVPTVSALHIHAIKMFTSFDYLGNVKKLPTPEEALEIITAMNSKKPDKAA